MSRPLFSKTDSGAFLKQPKLHLIIAVPPDYKCPVMCLSLLLDLGRTRPGTMSVLVFTYAQCIAQCLIPSRVMRKREWERGWEEGRKEMNRNTKGACSWGWLEDGPEGTPWSSLGLEWGLHWPQRTRNEIEAENYSPKEGSSRKYRCGITFGTKTGAQDVWREKGKRRNCICK